ncbi:hypothetical protein [Clostridium butyricum]|uniref:hypothetical protein n=2 Tax=Clostridium butyricum TaxID=1492 RepID=UPI002AB1CA69|nr:hypothetical protein [Clostridium butyricum]
MPIWIFESAFLGLKGGFWLIGLPLAISMIYLEVYKYKKQKKEIEEVEDLPLENIIIKLSKDEKWMLDNLIKRSNSKDLGDYINKSMKKR